MRCALSATVRHQVMSNFRPSRDDSQNDSRDDPRTFSRGPSPLGPKLEPRGKAPGYQELLEKVLELPEKVLGSFTRIQSGELRLPRCDPEMLGKPQTEAQEAQPLRASHGAFTTSETTDLAMPGATAGLGECGSIPSTIYQLLLTTHSRGAPETLQRLSRDSETLSTSAKFEMQISKSGTTH